MFDYLMRINSDGVNEQWLVLHRTQSYVARDGLRRDGRRRFFRHLDKVVSTVIIGIGIDIVRPLENAHTYAIVTPRNTTINFAPNHGKNGTKTIFYEYFGKISPSAQSG